MRNVIGISRTDCKQVTQINSLLKDGNVIPMSTRGLYRTIQDYTGLYRTIQDYTSGLFNTISNYRVGFYKTRQDGVGRLFRTVLRYYTGSDRCCVGFRRLYKATV